MSSKPTNLLAYKMRKLVTKYGDGPQLQEAIKELLNAERNLRSGQYYGLHLVDCQSMSRQELQST